MLQDEQVGKTKHKVIPWAGNNQGMPFPSQQGALPPGSGLSLPSLGFALYLH
jgi:hypothetical protein